MPPRTACRLILPSSLLLILVLVLRYRHLLLTEYRDAIDDVSSSTSIRDDPDVEATPRNATIQLLNDNASPPISNVTNSPTSPNASSPYDTTIVTAFFRVSQKIKHSQAEYDRWMSNLLSLDAPIIIFTNVFERIEPIRRARAPRGAPTLFVNVTYEELETVKRYEARITSLMSKDLQRNVNSPALYCIWYAKTELMQRAVATDPFATPKFCWLDIGILRNSGLLPLKYYVGKRWPDPARSHLIKLDKIMMGSVEVEKPSCKSLNWIEAWSGEPVKQGVNLATRDFTRLADFPLTYAFIAGASFCGGKEVMRRYCEVYAKAVEEYVMTERPAYHFPDQHLMRALSCIHHDWIEVVRPLRTCRYAGDRAWFFLMIYLGAEWQDALAADVKKFGSYYKSGG